MQLRRLKMTRIEPITPEEVQTQILMKLDDEATILADGLFKKINSILSGASLAPVKIDLEGMIRGEYSSTISTVMPAASGKYLLDRVISTYVNVGWNTSACDGGYLFKVREKIENE